MGWISTSKSSTVSLGEIYFSRGSLPMDLSKCTKNFIITHYCKFVYQEIRCMRCGRDMVKIEWHMISNPYWSIWQDNRLSICGAGFNSRIRNFYHFYYSHHQPVIQCGPVIKLTNVPIMTRQSCIKCRTIPTDILVLQCDHSLCIKCASFCCCIDSSTIICPHCKSGTYLEDDIIHQISDYSVELQGEELRRAPYFQHKKPLPAKQVWYKMSNKENDTIGNNQYESFNKYESRCRMSRKNSVERPSELKKPKKQAKNHVKQYEEQDKGSSNISTFNSIRCKYHNEYEVMYLCQQCQSSIICPECVIHGEHKNHQVETIKKTITKIHAELSSKIYSLDCSIEGLVGASEQKKQKLKNKIDQINKLKMEAASKYKMIRQEIAKEEAEVMSKCTKLIACFEEDFEQIQKWIKNDLLTIQKQRDSINYILNPYGKNSKKPAKVDQKLIQLKVVEEYINHFKKNDKYKSNKYLWLNNKEAVEQCLPQNEQNLTTLTDRIQRIRFVPTASSSMKVDFNEIATKNHSLAASRNLNTLHESNNGFYKDKKQSYARYVESPFNNLKMSNDKENNGFETESILVKASYMRDSSKMKRKSLKSEEQTNFLIF